MSKSAMLLPKPRPRNRTPFIPALREDGYGIGRLFARLTPPERALLRHIVEHSDLVRTPGAPDHLLVQVTPHMLDMLAAFEAEMEDLEPFMEDEPQDEDDDTASDLEADYSDWEPDQTADYAKRRDARIEAAEAKRADQNPTYAAYMAAKKAGHPDAVSYMNWLRMHPPAWDMAGAVVTPVKLEVR